MAKLTYDRLREAYREEAGENAVYHFFMKIFPSSSGEIPVEPPPSNANRNGHSPATPSSSDVKSSLVVAASSGN